LANKRYLTVKGLILIIYTLYAYYTIIFVKDYKYLFGKYSIILGFRVMGSVWIQQF